MRTKEALLAGAMIVCAIAFSFAHLHQSANAIYEQARDLTGGGDAESAPAKIHAYGCDSCHIIPGIAGEQGTVGPRLDQMRTQFTLAGELPNTAENMAGFIQHPRALVPQTAMPEMGVTEQDARDITAYLYTIR